MRVNCRNPDSDFGTQSTLPTKEHALLDTLNDSRLSPQIRFTSEFIEFVVATVVSAAWTLSASALCCAERHRDPLIARGS
jgi:hypothetical protein